MSPECSILLAFRGASDSGEILSQTMSGALTLNRIWIWNSHLGPPVSVHPSHFYISRDHVIEKFNEGAASRLRGGNDPT